MVYCDFSNSLYKYLDIYHNGLKKLANKEMQAKKCKQSLVIYEKCQMKIKMKY